MPANVQINNVILYMNSEHICRSSRLCPRV